MEIAASREASPPTATPPPGPSHHLPQPTRKRKHAAIAHAAASPAPSDPGATPAPENLVLSHRHADLASRPRLTISRHPQFVPLAPGSRFYTTEPLFNRMNFRYMPAGVCPPESASPFRTIESKPPTFRISWEDRSPFIHVTPDGLELQGEKGFRSARCNAPMREGRWYMEVKIDLGAGDRAPGLKRKEGSHVRLGWARREAPLNAPAGYDGYSYAIRDKTGEKVHLSRPRPYGRPFKTGDVVGMYICLPPRRKPDKRDPYDPAQIKRERIAIEFKGQEYFESLEYAQSKEMIALMDANDRAKATDTKSLPSSTKKSATVKNLPSTGRGKGRVPETTPMRPVPTLGPKSYIAFFINGESQGIAFQDIYDFLPLRTPPSKSEQKKRVNREGLREHKENPFDDGTLGYYPFISLFNGAQVQINPGPDFDFPPPPDIDAVVANPGADIKPQPDSKRTWRPACERYPEFMQEQWALDEQEEIEARKNLPALEAEWAKQEKAEEEKTKRRVQAAAARRERKVAQKAQETGSHKRAKTAPDHAYSPAPTGTPAPPGAFPRAESSASLGECYAPPMIIPSASAPNLRELATPELREGSERIPSPAPTVASSIDAQIAGLAGYGDTSAYNTDDDADLVPHDTGVETDGDVELAEADPIEDAVSYTYGVRR
ncbi:hypothetical protein K466DRAFT_598347 [Polyporus arcularius HHB13444]|uniref:B30.2/SPRY domain-containing protein n=1 Tax=Polyporus arcularius HHB13444 TaxID=1314778 RepID=A0A5C3PHL7_9APHY|nr:hypothetical protein K466DRAFT_598347 [Polyporus arcularius HHB13444]